MGVNGGATEPLKPQFALFLSKRPSFQGDVAVECSAIGLKFVPISEEDEALEWLWSRGREIRLIIIDEAFPHRAEDNVPNTLARDWPEIRSFTLSQWRNRKAGFSVVSRWSEAASASSRS